jgi:IS1 family transposase
MANRLSTEKRGQIIGCLTEGMSMRATSRVTGAARNTVDKLLLDLGAACSAYADDALYNLDSKRIECDEIWGFVHAKDRNLPEQLQDDPDFGSVWCWVAIDADTKLIPSWLVGERSQTDCWAFLQDLQNRLNGRIQLTTDGLTMYVNVVEDLWGADIDYAVVHKLYSGGITDEAHRYSPPSCSGLEKHRKSGRPDMKKANTAYVERQNLTMRMGMRRYTRLTNAFSKKIEQHTAAVALHFMHYNFARPHQTLSKKAGTPTTPAMAAGVERYPWSLTQIAELLD